MKFGFVFEKSYTFWHLRQLFCDRFSFCLWKNTPCSSPESSVSLCHGALHPQGDANWTQGITDWPGQPQIGIFYGVSTGLYRDTTHTASHSHDSFSSNGSQSWILSLDLSLQCNVNKWNNAMIKTNTLVLPWDCVFIIETWLLSTVGLGDINWKQYEYCSINYNRFKRQT